jgi:hypothetical protein
MAIKDEKPSPEAKAYDLLIRAKDANRLLLRSKPNVIGLDVGLRVKGGKVTKEKVVKVYVSRKIDKQLLPENDLIPSVLEIESTRVPVDVEESKIYQPIVFDSRVRPLIGGPSISPHNRWYSGTLGVCVTLNDDNTYILSCNHVLADSNQLAIGTNIIQPSRQDGGHPVNDVVATLSDFVPLDFGTTTLTLALVGNPTVTMPNTNYVDAAIAQVNDAFNGANREIHWVGYPEYYHDNLWTYTERQVLLGRRVCKMGRTTHYTLGEITSVSYDAWVGVYSNGHSAWFEDQIRIEGLHGKFAAPGDSGSLVVDAETKRPLGLLFAARGNLALANRIDKVIRELDIPQI